MAQFEIEWLDAEREPECEPDPRYPNGVELDMSQGQTCCKVELPYPAKRCGAYHIHCNWCNLTAGVTTAGRPDDPRLVILPCKPIRTGGQVH